CGLKVSRPRVLAVDRFLGDQCFEPVDRRGGGLEKLARARLAESCDQRRRRELEAGENLATVARAGAPADVLALEHEHGCTGPREVPRGGQPGISRADDDHIDARWKRGLGTWDWGLGTARARQGIPPVWVLVH